MATAVITAANVLRPQSSNQEDAVTTNVFTDDFGDVPNAMDEPKTTEHSSPHSSTKGWSTHDYKLSK